MLSTWIRDARQWAKGNETYAAYLEYNSRNQITLWGPDGEINDYASKQWAGMVGGYHIPRWETFIEYLATVKKTGGSSAYNVTEISARLLDIGKEFDVQIWGNKTRGETWGTKGDVFSLAQGILDTWA